MNVLSRFKSIMFMLCAALLGMQTIAEAATWYRTKNAGDWTTPGIWEECTDGTNWGIAVSSPTDANSDSILIQHNVTVTQNFSFDQTQMTSGQLTINSGITVTVQHKTGATEDLTLSVLSPFPGDINFDRTMNLTDLILSQQVLAGVAIETDLYVQADANGDLIIGSEECIYILQVVGELRN